LNYVLALDKDSAMAQTAYMLWSLLELLKGLALADDKDEMAKPSLDFAFFICQLDQPLSRS